MKGDLFAMIRLNSRLLPVRAYKNRSPCSILYTTNAPCQLQEEVEGKTGQQSRWRIHGDGQKEKKKKKKCRFLKDPLETPAGETGG